MTEQQAIEAIANDIQDGIYGFTQKCGNRVAEMDICTTTSKKNI